MYRGYLFAVLLFACQASAWAGSPHDTVETAGSPGERAVRTDPVVELIRSKLVEPSLRSTADPADVAALQAFYSSRAAPLWITDMAVELPPGSLIGGEFRVVRTLGAGGMVAVLNGALSEWPSHALELSETACGHLHE